MATTNKQMEELMSPDDMMMPQEDVTKERAVKAAKDVLTFGAESTPVLGEIIAAKRTGDAIQEGDYIGAAVEAAAGVLGIVPAVGDAAGRSLRQLPNYNLKDPDSRVFHLTSRDYDAADVVGKGTDDMGFHVGTAKQASGRGTKATGERILPMVLKAKLKPARIPDLGSFKEPKNWLANLAVDKNDRQIMKFLKGDPEDAELLKKAPTVKTGGTTYIMSPDVIKAGVDPDLWKDLILEASRASRVRPNPYQIGLDTVNNRQDRLEWFSTIKGVANKHGYDSYIYKNDYEGKVGDGPQDSYMLLEADQAKGIFGGLTEGEPEFMKNRGGVISMKKGGVAKQMEMFEPVERGFNSGALVSPEKVDVTIFDFNEIADSYNKSIGKDLMSGAEMSALFDAFIDMKTAAKASGMNEGGLAEDGGSVDPVSGNSVPPGSTKEEVRDDIPAQLSEGEFVFPADVVRYIGLEKLMQLRQEAKMGLAAMEAMGQMGNSEEATMPDDLPFDMYDLDIEDDNEYNMAQGGVVKMQQGGTNYTPPTVGGFVTPPPVTTGFSGPQPVQPFQSGQSQFKVAGTAEGAVTPKTAVDPVVPTFSDFIGQNVPGVDFKMVTFYDENGQAKVLKQFPDGSYEDPANPGVKVTPADMGLTQEVKTTPTTTQQRVETAKVVDDGGKDEPVDNRSTDVTGIKYNASGLTDNLASVIDEFGGGLGTLVDALNPQMYERVASKLGITDGISQKTNAITSAALGGVFDNYRGVTVTVDPRFGNVRTYADNTPLDQLGTTSQNRLASVARATVTRIQSIITDPNGEALNTADTQTALEAALRDQYDLTQPEIDAIANVGGNYNQNQKLSRHLSGLIAKDETKKAVDKSMTDYASMVSSKPELSKDDPSPDGYTGGKGASEADKQSGAATQAAADSFTDKGFEDTSGEGGYGGP